MSFDGRVAYIPVHVRDDMPLEHDGVPVLFWFKEGAIHVHPSRLKEMRVLLVAGSMPFPVPSRTG
jgi:hypothetical protein